MCAVCQHRDDDCSHFSFELFPVLSEDESEWGEHIITVRCPTFAKPDVQGDK